MDKERLEEVFSEQVFIQSFLDSETPEEIQVIFKERGIEMTIEEITVIWEIFCLVKNGEATLEDVLELQKYVENLDGGELNEEELENVSGGVAPLLDIIGGVALKALVKAGVKAVVACAATLASYLIAKAVLKD